MQATYIHPPSDPDVAHIVATLTDSLETLPQVLEQCRAQLEQGVTLGELRGITREEYAALYCMASDLCDVGDFHHALPIALQLAVNNPFESRYAFIAGACLQRLGHHDRAAAMYALACDADPDDAAAAFRLGECLAALGHFEPARDFLNRCIDLSYGSCDRRRLQDMARARIASIA